MYDFMLMLHSGLRWLVALLAVVAVVTAWIATRRNGGRWPAPLRTLGKVYVGLFDLQLLVGVLLYVWLSPLTTGAFNALGEAMKVGELRYFVVEHVVMMVAAAVLIHVGVALARKSDSALKAAMLYTFALLIMIPGIPWARVAAGG